MTLPSLPIFVAVRGRAVMLVGGGAAAAAKRRLLERAGARIVAEAGEAALAIVAIDDDAEATATIVRLKARGILVNAVDRPAFCDFTLPAIVDRAPVLIAIGTGGASAGLAAALRQYLERLMPQTLGGLADALFAARGAIRAQFPEPADRRIAISAALSEGGVLDPLVSTPETVAAWLASAGPVTTGTVARIALRSDDPDDLTIREARWLAQADRLYAAGDIPAAILDRARADAIRETGTPPDTPHAGLTVVLTLSSPPARPYR